MNIGLKVQFQFQSLRGDMQTTLVITFCFDYYINKQGIPQYHINSYNLSGFPMINWVTKSGTIRNIALREHLRAHIALLYLRHSILHFTDFIHEFHIQIIIIV